MNSALPQTIATQESDGLPVQESINLRHYWYVMLERRWLIIISTILILALSLAYLYFAPKIYQARARLQIDREGTGFGELKRGTSVGGTPVDTDYLQTMYKRIGSPRTLERVIERLGLAKDSRYSRELDPVAALSRDVSVEPVRMTRLVDIKVKHTNARTAADIANVLAADFIEENKATVLGTSNERVVYLRSEVGKLKREVTDAEQTLQAIASQSGEFLLDGSQNIVAEALSRAQASYSDALSRAQAADTIVLELGKHLAAGKTVSSFPMIAANQQLNQLQMQLVSLQNEMAGLKEKYKDKHPAVTQVNSRIDEAQRAISRIAEQAAEALRTEATIAKAQMNGMKDLVRVWQKQQAEWVKAKMEYDRTRRDVEVSQSIYQEAYKSFKTEELDQKDAKGNVTVVEGASAPPVPASPNPPLVLALGIMLAFGGSVGLGLFVNFMDSSVKSQDDVETYLRVPFLGYIANIHSNSAPERYLYSQVQPQSGAAESYRSLRAAISLGQRGTHLKMITVTSTIPGEGKSMTAANLAIVMAQTGLRTLLVDADLRRPWLAKAFQITPTLSLVDYLSGGPADVRDLFKTTEVPNLDVVCAGVSRGQTSELTASKKMTQFLEEVTHMYDRVIVDSPPVSAVSDALVLSSVADGVLYVMKFNKIRRDHARKSIQRLQDAGAHLCGVILNDIDFEGRDSYYYSSYFYQNRYYENYEVEAPEEILESADSSVKRTQV